MTTRLLILLPFLLITIHAVGQISLPTSVFHKYTQLFKYDDQFRNFAETTEKDFVMEIFHDSTVKITEYTCSYLDSHNSLLRFTYIGKYKLANDTLRINYLTHKCELRHKSSPINGVERTSPSDSFFFYPPSTYVFNHDLLTSTDDNSLALTRANPSKARELDTKFNSWDKSNAAEKKIRRLTKN